MIAPVHPAERAVRLLPLPAKTALKEARHALDPVFRRVYRRRTGYRGALPPSALRARTGSPGFEAFIEGGRRHANELHAALNHLGRRPEEFSSVLDYGCGSGRVLVPFMGAWPGTAEFAGSDVDAEAVAWARGHHPRARWEVNRSQPPLAFADESFDLVYSVSIFTHFDEGLQLGWLEEVCRVLRPGGLGLVTVHGPHAFEECRSGRVVSNTRACAQRVASHHSLETEGFVFEPYVVDRWNAHDFPGVDEPFGMAFHAATYVGTAWSRWFEILDILPTALGGWQDIVAVRRP
jgi:SAM-dependent methyltransferase